MSADTVQLARCMRAWLILQQLLVLTQGSAAYVGPLLKPQAAI
jgi:hypothetical protein